eukprot:5017001-Prymnesium_polylepis.1
MLDGTAALIEILEEVGRVAWPAREIAGVALHLDAHLDRLVRAVMVSRWQRRPLAPRHEWLRLAVLVPRVLEIRVHVAGLSRRDEQPILVAH